MILEPGPLPSIPPPTATPADDPGNVAFVKSWAPAFDAADQAMDSIIDPNAIIDLVLPDDGSDADIALVGFQLDAFGGGDSGVEMITGDAAAADLAEKLHIAYSVTPAEAFQPVPPQLFQPPGSPVIPPQATSDATINNLTRPGDPNFYPGDQYEISIQLAPSPGGEGQFAGVAVTMYSSQGTTPWPPQNLCLTDNNGALKSTGILGAADVGNWILLLQPGVPSTAGGLGAVGGLPPELQINFNVIPPPGVPWPPPDGSFLPASGLHPVQSVGAPCQTSSITVSLENTDNPGAVNFISGDHWILTVQGLPMSDVVIWALNNNVPLGSELLGQTDQNGFFQLAGQMTDQYIGSWVENYSVGGEVWNGNLIFFVVAAPTAPTSTVV